MKNISKLMLSLSLFLTACNKLEYDPNQSVNLESASQLNYHNASKITSIINKEEICFAVTGDSHLDYDNLEKAVSSINKDKSIRFTIHLGDITDHGLLKEFQWATAVMQKLNNPYLVTLGNHDLVARGEDTYKQMFGTPNFSLIIDSVKFIFFNSNSREYNFNGKVPDLSWLDKQLSEGNNFNRSVLLSHVPYWDVDYDWSLKTDYLKLIDSKEKPVIASFSGHLHNTDIHLTKETNVPHLVPGAVNRKTYLKVIINQKGISYESIYF